MPRVWRSVSCVIFITCLATLLINFGVDGVFMAALSRPTKAKPWQEIVAAKRSADDAKIPATWRLDPRTISEAKAARRIAGDFIEGLLDDATCHITAMDVTDLVDSMANGSLTAVQVVTAFSQRASYAHQMVGCHFEFLFPSDVQLSSQIADIFISSWNRAI